jgi:8-oxo-dGTP pyrophosphatase MutT (NUDIX family)
MPLGSGYLRHFVACNRHDLDHFAPFFIGDQRYGRIKKELVPILTGKTKFFDLYKDGVALASRFADFDARSDALMQITALLSKHFGKALRNEMYPVVLQQEDAPVAQLDRIAVPWFGVRAWGLHVNGFVRKKDGLYLWVGERASDRLVEPGKLDNMIGGGQPIGLTREQNLCKEAWEEAGVDKAVANTATYARTIDYMLEMPHGLRADTLHTYDLELPETFTPRNTDGEVASFSLMPLAQIAELLRTTDKFKFNCPLVITDFLIRHGFITPQDAEYMALKKWLGN